MQREKQEYFIPNIEDLRVGYEYERQYTTNIWINEVIEEWDFRTPQLREPCDSNITEILRDLNSNKIRVPYLTKEQIEAEGWKISPYSFLIINCSNEEKNEYTYKFFKDKYNLIYEEAKNIIKIWYYDEYSSNCNTAIGLFKGECRDINTFRYICKLLNI